MDPIPEGDWGFEPRRSGLSNAVKVGITMGLVMMIAFGLLLYRKWDDGSLNAVFAGDKPATEEAKSSSEEPLPSAPTIEIAAPAEENDAPKLAVWEPETPTEPTPLTFDPAAQVEPGPTLASDAPPSTFTEPNTFAEPQPEPFIRGDEEAAPGETTATEVNPFMTPLPPETEAEQVPEPAPLEPFDAPETVTEPEPLVAAPTADADPTPLFPVAEEDPNTPPEPITEVDPFAAATAEPTPSDTVTEPVDSPEATLEPEASGNPFETLGGGGLLTAADDKMEEPATTTTPEPEPVVELDPFAEPEQPPFPGVLEAEAANDAEPVDAFEPFPEPETTAEPEPVVESSPEQPAFPAFDETGTGAAEMIAPEPLPVASEAPSGETPDSDPFPLVIDAGEPVPAEPEALGSAPITQTGGAESEDLFQPVPTGEPTPLPVAETPEPEPQPITLEPTPEPQPIEVAQGGADPFGDPFSAPEPTPIPEPMTDPEPTPEFDPSVSPFPPLGAGPETDPEPTPLPETIPAEPQPLPSTNVVGNAPTAKTPAPIYEVQPGDNYWTISKRAYGTPIYFMALHRHNEKRVPDPKKLRPGMKIETPKPEVLAKRYPKTLPKNAVRSTTAGGSVGNSIATGNRPATNTPQGQSGFFLKDGKPAYRVGDSDTLGGIAHRHLGRASRWIQIYQMNKQVVSNPDRLKVGTVLMLPTDASRVSLVGSETKRQ